jgi:hypothetical protein
MPIVLFSFFVSVKAASVLLAAVILGCFDVLGLTGY